MSDRRWRRLPAIALAALCPFALSACDGAELVRTGDTSPQILVVSAAADSGRERLVELQRALERLRSSTGSGWVGRQDEVTGYLGELSGGRYAGSGASGAGASGAGASGTGASGAGADDGAAGVIAELFDEFGPELFGIGAQELDLDRADADGSSPVRVTQRVDDVPVLDGELVVSVTAAEDGTRVNAVRGRVFPGLDVTTRPTIRADRARRVAERISGGLAQERPRLVVVPTGTGELAWEVAVAAIRAGSGPDDNDNGDGGDEARLRTAGGRYYVSASTGDLVTVRRTSNEGFAPTVLQPTAQQARRSRTLVRGLATADPTGAAVEVSGTGPLGEPRAAVGVRSGAGVQLVDPTVPTYRPEDNSGGIVTHDALDGSDDAALPGPVHTSNSTTIGDPDAIAAHALSRAVYDYLAALGWASWDDEGSSLVSSVNFGDGDFCNAFFSSELRQMVYGNPCEGPGGEVQLVTPDVAAHEITHGVTDSSAGLIYSGQSGALNESFSDYLGNVIGNLVNGTDGGGVGEDACAGVTAPMRLCDVPAQDGGFLVRDMLNGTTFADYLHLLNPPLRLLESGYDDQDNGGVHLNSAIWNNALWTIRTRLAQIDGVPGNESALAGDLDKIVFAALTTQLGPTSGFLDARRAVEQTIVESGADPVVLRVAREVFDAHLICEGCVDPGPVPGQAVSTATATELSPAISGDRIAWLTQGDGVLGTPASSSLGGSARSLTDTPDTAQVVLTGDAVVALEYPDGRIPGRVVRYGDDGATTLGEAGRSTLVAGLAGSDSGAAWASAEAGTVSFADPSGQVTTADLPDLGGATVTAVSVGDGVVGLGTSDGRVLRWSPNASFTDVGRVGSAVLATATHGDRVLAVDDEGIAALFDAEGVTVVSEVATPFGAAVNATYAVWSEAVGELGGGVAETQGGRYVDTDLHLFSSSTGTIYNLLPERGQQGFPAISGDRLVWQDSVRGGDDIYTATIPAGL